MALPPPARALLALIAISISVLAMMPSAFVLDVTPAIQHAGSTAQPTAFESVVAEIAYRSTTGSNGTGAPKTRALDGPSWTAEAEQADAGSSIRAVRMAWSPVIAGERIFVTQSADGALDAYVCNPACTVTNDIGQVWATGPNTPERRFDVAYESVSGEAVLAYGTTSSDPTQDIAYRTYVGGGWSAEQYLDDLTEAGDVQYTLIALASRGGSDQLGLLGAETTNNHVNAWIWDGGAFGSFVEVNAGAENPDENQAAIAWETGSGNLLAVSVDAGTADCTFMEFSGAWGAATTVPCGSSGPVRWLSLKPNPAANAQDMVLAVGDNGADLNTMYWDGTAWTGPVIQDTGMDFATARSFDFAWEATGNRGVLVWGTTSGQITYSAFTAPNTWSLPTDVAMGSSTHRWVQLRTNTAPVPGATRVLGAVLDNANSLGAIAWDGTSLTVDGPDVFTANAGSSTFESFDLQARIPTSGFTLNLFGGGTLNLFGFHIGYSTLAVLVAGIAGLVFLLMWRRSRRGSAPSAEGSTASDQSGRRASDYVTAPEEPEAEPEPEVEGEAPGDYDPGEEGAEPDEEPEEDVEDEVEATPPPRRGRQRW